LPPATVPRGVDCDSVTVSPPAVEALSVIVTSTVVPTGTTPSEVEIVTVRSCAAVAVSETPKGFA